MRLIVTPIPDKSHGVRVWPHLLPGNELPKNKEPYSFACNLIYLDKDTCEVSQAIGDLSNEISIAIGLKAAELGYRKLLFCRATGGTASRWGSYVKTENGLDYYEVDLVSAVQVYTGVSNSD